MYCYLFTLKGIMMSEVVSYGITLAKIIGKEKPNLHLDTLRLSCCMADSILPGFEHLEYAACVQCATSGSG
jgi:hypothetical protein